MSTTPPAQPTTASTPTSQPPLAPPPGEPVPVPPRPTISIKTSRPASAASSVASSAPPSEASSSNSQRHRSSSRWEFPETTPVPVPRSGNYFFHFMTMNGKYKQITFAMSACSMFVRTIHKEYTLQVENAKKKGKELSGFTWKNSGDLAENFAIVCDQAKLLHAALVVSDRCDFKSLLDQLIPFLQAQTKIPTDILSAKTYVVKIKDWEKGGTRYNAHDSSGGTHNNIQFAVATRRSAKLEAYMQANGDLQRVPECASVVVPHDGAGGAGSTSPQPQRTAAPAVQAPARVAVKAPAAPTTRFAAKTIVIPQLYDDTVVAQKDRLRAITGSGVVFFRDERIDEHMKDFVQLGKEVRDPVLQIFMAGIIVKSSIRVHLAFEKEGGFCVMRDWVVGAIERHNDEHFTRFLESILTMFQAKPPAGEQHPSPMGKLTVSAETQAYWRRLEADRNLPTPNFEWLRGAKWPRGITTQQQVVRDMVIAAIDGPQVAVDKQKKARPRSASAGGVPKSSAMDKDDETGRWAATDPAHLWREEKLRRATLYAELRDQNEKQGMTRAQAQSYLKSLSTRNSVDDDAPATVVDLLFDEYVPPLLSTPIPCHCVFRDDVPPDPWALLDACCSNVIKPKPNWGV